MKSDCATARALFGINRQLRLAEARKDPYKLKANSPAEFLIRSIKPLDYEAIRPFDRSISRLVGDHTLRAVGLVKKPRCEIYYPLAIIERDEQMFGIGVSSRILHQAAEDLGLPPLGIKFHKLHEAVAQSTQLPGWMHIGAMVQRMRAAA